MKINAYLKRCMVISLRRRAVWVLVGGGVGLGFAVLLGLGLTDRIVLTLCAVAVTALTIAVNSYLRHSADQAAQPGGGYTVAASRTGLPPH